MHTIELSDQIGQMHGANQGEMARFGGEQVLLLVVGCVVWQDTCQRRRGGRSFVMAPERAQTTEGCGAGDVHEAASGFLASPLVAMKEVRLDMASRA